VKYRRRVALPHVGLVSVEMLLDVYMAHRARAVRLARDIAGDEAEDVVQDVTTYLLRRLDTLRHMDRSLFFTSVKRAAVKRVTEGWHRHHVTMALDELLVAEAKLYRPGKRPYDGPVRLPSPPAAYSTHGKFSSVP
jgi:DNA-directed RNA polymerase specialized sigma24 family protein